MYTVAVAADDGSVVESGGVRSCHCQQHSSALGGLMAVMVISHSASIQDKKAATLTIITPELEHIYFYFR